MKQDPFQEYMRDSESGKREKGYAWRIGIGLQAVDGLKISDYLLHTAARNIEGEISFQEANVLLQSYYEEHPSRNFEDRTEEADKVSVRIAELLSEKAFSLHRRRTFQFIANYLRGFIRKRDASGTITLPNRSVFLTEQAFFTAVQQSKEQLWTMIFPKKETSRQGTVNG